MRILFAEDSKAIARHIAAVLEEQGHQVIHVMDGRAAIEAYQANPPDLVLMDVVMPEMDGIEATRRIKALGGDRWVPLIFMTGLTSTNELVAGFEAGADDYLTKPINLDVLNARIQAMQRIATMQDSLFGVLDNVYEGIVTINGKGTIQAFNKAAEQIFGYTATEVMGANVNMLMPNPYRDEHDGYLARYQVEGKPRIIGKGRQVSGRRKNGEVFPMHLAVTEVHGQRGRTFIGLVRDISEEAAARERIEYLASHDSLTGLPNRSRLNDTLDAMLHGDRAGHLLFIDLDGFKPINDQLGHEAGDQALIEVARRLKLTLGKNDFVGRLGGDEFVVILTQTSNNDEALSLARALIAAISVPMQLLSADITRTLGASIGIVPVTPGQGTRTMILTAADHAMYRAKRQGKGQAQLAQSIEQD